MRFGPEDITPPPEHDLAKPAHPTRTFTPAEKAVLHLVAQLKRDPRLAYLIGPGSESFELLVTAAAVLAGEEWDPYRESFLGALTMQPVPSIGKVGAVIDPEVLERIAEYDDDMHDLDQQSNLDMLVNHFVRRGLTVAEDERDTQTEELF